MEILAQILILLLVAKVAGGLALRLGQPPIVGEIAGGILLALLLVNLAADVPLLGSLPNSEIVAYAMQLGIFFLMLSAGIELEPEDIQKRSGASFLVAAGGFLLPMILGASLAWFLIPDGPLKLAQAILVGITLSITAVPATVATLSELHLLHRKSGETIVAAAIFDDVIGLFMLSILFAVMNAGQVPQFSDFAILILKVSAFFAITIGLGTRVYPAVHKRVRALDLAALEFSALVLVGLFYALLAELLGMHWMMGAFLAGLFFEPSRVGNLAHSEMKIIASGLSVGVLGPVFFTIIGLWVSLDILVHAPFVVLGFVLIAIIGKVLGCGLPALAGSLGPRDATVVGVGMCSKGAITLIVLSVAKDGGLFEDSIGNGSLVSDLYSALVLMAIFVTLLTPLLLKATYKHQG